MAEYKVYDLLWQVAQKEKQTSELQLLPKTFYDDISVFLQTLDKNESSDEDQTIKKNTTKLLNDLFERRKQKLLTYVTYKKPIPQPAVQSEQEFYNSVLEIIKNTKLNTTQPNKTPSQTLKSLQSIPEILLPSGKKIGPLTKDQIINTCESKEDAEFLVSSALCIPI